MKTAEEQKMEKLLLDFLDPKSGKELSESEINQVSDMDKLISYWENTSSGSEAERLVEARMTEVLKEKLPNVSDMDKLISYWENTSSGSEAERLVEARMTEVLKEISDMDKLISYWENTSSGSELRRLVEARMTEVLKEINPDDIPEWFKKMLKNPQLIPA